MVEILGHMQTSACHPLCYGVAAATTAAKLSWMRMFRVCRLGWDAEDMHNQIMLVISAVFMCRVDVLPFAAAVA